MTLTRLQHSNLDKKLEDRYQSLLEEVRDELEKSENQQYIELIGRTPADIGDESVGDALADLNLEIIDRHIQEIRDIEAHAARVWSTVSRTIPSTRGSAPASSTAAASV